jgi:hypothetical protein
LKIDFSPADMLPLMKAALAEVMAKLETDAALLGASDQLAYDEPRAADLLGCRRHVLRDARKAGLVKAARIGRGVYYRRSELLRFLQQQEGA